MQPRRTIRYAPFWSAVVLLLCALIAGLWYVGKSSTYAAFANGTPVTLTVVERSYDGAKTFEYDYNGTRATDNAEYISAAQLARLNIGDTVEALRHSSGSVSRFVLRDSLADLKPSLGLVFAAVVLLVAALATFWLAFTPTVARPVGFDVVAESVRRTYRNALLMALGFGVMGTIIALPLVFGSSNEPTSLTIWLVLGGLVLVCLAMVGFSGRMAWRNRTVAVSPLQRALTDQPSPIVWAYVGIAEHIAGSVIWTNLPDDGRSAIDKAATQTFVNIGLLSKQQMRLAVRDVADAVLLVENIRRMSPAVRVGYSQAIETAFRHNPAALQFVG